MRRLEEYVSVGQKRLRCGYTTGTCAAAAARAAAELLLAGREVPAVVIGTPAGVDVVVEVEECAAGPGWAECAVRKDAGDDPDVTDGVLVVVRVEFSSEPGVRVEGGAGVGRVTLPGLDQPVGELAINSVPRAMIREQVEEVLRAARAEGEGNRAARASSAASPSSRVILSGTSEARGVEGSPPFQPFDEPCEGLLVTVSVPGGEELAGRTFNPRLGIVGGISIIGTTGIVRPMSEDAMVSSLELEMRTLAARGVRDLLVVPGNYGLAFARDTLGLRVDEAVQCSNYFGAVLDAAVLLGFRRVLLVGHLGKLVKVAGGIMNTHSRVADCRMEVLAAHAALAGASQDAVREIMDAATTDAVLDILARDDLLEPAMASLVGALGERLTARVGKKLQVEAIVFSNKHGLLGATPGAVEMSKSWPVDGVDPAGGTRKAGCGAETTSSTEIILKWRL